MTIADPNAEVRAQLLDVVRAFTANEIIPTAAEYDHVLGRELRDEPLDLAILGVGEDGHIAGLFAGHAALEELTRVAAIDNAPRAPYRRLTMTMSFLISTPEIWIVAVGERKRAIVQAAAMRISGSSPFDILLRHAGNVTIFTDQMVQRSNPPVRTR